MAHKNKENRSPWKDRQNNKQDDAPSKQTNKDNSSNRKTLRGKHQKSSGENFTFQQADDRLYDTFRHHGLASFPHEKRRQLTEFYFLLIENQKKHNFSRLLKLRDIAIKHFIDSVILDEVLNSSKHKINQIKEPLLDIGTGPGFPGVPLKILYPELKITLAEGVQSRVVFLKHVRESLKLKKLDIIGKNITPEFLYPVGGVITRAVEDISNTLSNASNCLRKGGKIYLMKGPNVDPEILPAEKKWGKFYSLVEDINYNLPNTPHQRRLLVYEKIKSIPLDEQDFDEDFN